MPAEQSRVFDFCGIIPDVQWLRGFISAWLEFGGYVDHFERQLSRQLGIAVDEFDELRHRKSRDELSVWIAERLASAFPSADEFLGTLVAAGIVGSCIYGGTGATAEGNLNDCVASLARQSEGSVKAFAGVEGLEGQDAVREIDRAILELGLHGVALAPFQRRVTADDGSLRSILHRCGELRVPVWIHTGNHWASDRPIELGHPRNLDSLAAEMPNLTIIAGHSGWPWMLEMCLTAWRHRNVYIDTSSHPPSSFTKQGSGWEPFLHYGPKFLKRKMLFGSNWLALGKPPAVVAQEAREVPFPSDVLEAYLHDNAVRLLHSENR